MSVSIDKVNHSKVMSLVTGLAPEDRKTFETCLKQTTSLYVGMVDKKFVCAWGLIPPTLMSETAYLWLYNVELGGHEFVFIRHSQRVIERMLEEYPTIVGVTKIGGSKTIRWLKWLGAKFGEPQGQLLPFVIRKK